MNLKNNANKVTKKKSKIDWPVLKETIINYIKFHMLTIFMSIGLWFVYTLIWFGVGLPQTNWAMTITCFLAIVSEYLYIRWVSK